MNSAMEPCAWVRGFLRLAPAENAPPASSPVNTASLISGSDAIASQRRVIPSLKSSPQALRAAGVGVDKVLMAHDGSQ